MKNRKVFFVQRKKFFSEINRPPQSYKKYIPKCYKKMGGAYKEKNGFQKDKYHLRSPPNREYRHGPDHPRPLPEGDFTGGFW